MILNEDEIIKKRKEIYLLNQNIVENETRAELLKREREDLRHVSTLIKENKFPSDKKMEMLVAGQFLRLKPNEVFKHLEKRLREVQASLQDVLSSIDKDLNKIQKLQPAFEDLDLLVLKLLTEKAEEEMDDEQELVQCPCLYLFTSELVL
eukprot:TRINITY_DN951_c0_g1_i7.p2 TRINITY_DN951_c0_g1~~TRINITY_DN951_c0_g1_i7.p2  ORF type:complete len:150 (+),score=25.57 TRINITY_DN951_c0_g1_i7:46-495(+)